MAKSGFGGMLAWCVRLSLTMGAGALVSACGGGSGSDSGTSTTPPPQNSSLGLMQITISGIGTAQMTSHAQMLGSGAQRPDLAQPSTVPLGLDVQQASASTVDVGTPGAGGERYFTVVYQVRNAQFCNTPGSCTPYSSASNNLTLIAANTASNINGTALTEIRLFDGSSSAATQALASSLLPTHGMEFDSATGSGVIVTPGLASLQVYTEAEVSSASIARDTGATDLFPYGYVVSNVKTPGSRSLPASPAANQWNGEVAFSFKLPLQSDPKQDPYSITMIFQVIDDANTRVTESPEEQDYAGDLAAIARATTLGASDIAVLGGRAAQADLGSIDPICTVRIAGPAATPPASPSAYLVNAANDGATVASAPYNLQGLSPSAAINVGLCTPMNAAGFGTMVVSGSQSGQRVSGGAYTGSYSANTQGNVLSFLPTQPFLAGETVSYTLSAGLTSSASTALTPFTGSYVAGGNVSSTGTFTASGAFTASTGAGTAPDALAVGDFNVDGKPDVAITDHSSDAVFILTNNGSGGFTTSTIHLGSTQPNAIAVGDFNGDGWPDLAVVVQGSGAVLVLLNDHAGGFSVSSPYFLGSGPGGIAVGDFNGDGLPDIAVTNNGSSTVSILLNHPGGTFTISPTSGTVAVGQNPVGIAVGDFNGDGKLDLVVANNNGVADSTHNTVSILTNDGTGAFTASTVVVGRNPVGVGVGDFNGDGLPDIAVADNSGGSVTILTNKGQGVFSAADVSVANGALEIAPLYLVVGDIDGDGKPDIVVADNNPNAPTNTYLSVLLNDGKGNLSLSSTPTVGNGPVGIALADFFGTHKAGVVEANISGASVEVLPQP